MRRIKNSMAGRLAGAASAAALCCSGIAPAWASDHFDSPAMTANPQADIGDIYAWTAPDGHRLNLAMTIVGRSFSDKLSYIFHIDSGKHYGATTASRMIICRFPGPKLVDCKLGGADRAHGDATDPHGLEARNRRFRLFAGLRDDPFYNNVKGSLGAYGVEAAAIKAGARFDAGGCPQLDPSTVNDVADRWRHTDGGPPANLLANWTASAIVISVDLGAVSKGGAMLAVWGSTASQQRQLDHMARPFVGNTLLGASPFSTDDASGAERESYNAATPRTAARFSASIAKALALHDGLDGKCGNQLLADRSTLPSTRYRQLAEVFADDRLWVNSASRVCTQFFAVELAQLAGRKAYDADCGGRSPTYDTPNVWRSLLIDGKAGGTHWDGLAGDEHPPSASQFPFLSSPDAHGIDH